MYNMHLTAIISVGPSASTLTIAPCFLNFLLLNMMFGILDTPMHLFLAVPYLFVCLLYTPGQDDSLEYLL